MKKFTLIFGAVILGFMLTSCGENKKDGAIKAFNTFFDNETAVLNQIEDAESLLEYYEASDERFTEFYKMLDEKYPIDDNGNFVGLSQEDSDTAMQVYTERNATYEELLLNKGAAFYEPILAEAEDVLFNEIGSLANQYESFEDVPEEVYLPLVEKLAEKYELAEKYFELGNDEQFERFYVLFDIFYGDGDEEGESEE